MNIFRFPLSSVVRRVGIKISNIKNGFYCRHLIGNATWTCIGFLRFWRFYCRDFSFNRYFRKSLFSGLKILQTGGVYKKKLNMCRAFYYYFFIKNRNLTSLNTYLQKGWALKTLSKSCELQRDSYKIIKSIYFNSFGRKLGPPPTVPKGLIQNTVSQKDSFLQTEAM